MNCSNCGKQLQLHTDGYWADAETGEYNCAGGDAPHIPQVGIPFTALQGGLIAAREFYESALSAGFTDRQALYITAFSLVGASIRPPDASE